MSNYSQYIDIYTRNLLKPESKLCSCLPVNSLWSRAMRCCWSSAGSLRSVVWGSQWRKRHLTSKHSLKQTHTCKHITPPGLAQIIMYPVYSEGSCPHIFTNISLSCVHIAPTKKKVKEEVVWFVLNFRLIYSCLIWEESKNLHTVASWSFWTTTVYLLLIESNS